MRMLKVKLCLKLSANPDESRDSGGTGQSRWPMDMNSISNWVNMASDHALAITMGIVVVMTAYLSFIKIRYGFGRVERLHKYNVRLSVKLLAKLQSGFSDAQMMTYLRKINPLVFEELILTALDRHNKSLKITRNNRYTGDGGSDGTFSFGGEAYQVQAKRYGLHINPAHVAEFKALVAKRGCKGLFIHTGRTGKKSWEHIENSNVKIISGSSLVALIKTGRF